jgi:hypothetical protein
LGISAKEALTLQILDVPSVANVSLGQNVSAVLTKEGEISTFGYGGSLLTAFQVWFQIWDHSPHHFVVFSHNFVSFW